MRAAALAGIGITSAIGFALVTRAVARRKTADVDRKVLDLAGLEDGHPARDAAEKIAPLGKWWTYLPAAALTGTAVFSSRRNLAGFAGSASIVGAGVIAFSLARAFDDLLPQPPSPPGRDRPDHPVFPSGHAFGTTAVALAAAYVLTREELCPAPLVFPAALALPLASSVARMIEEKHWISDIAGGFLAATAVSSLTCAGYETCVALSDRASG